jgi:hypothetical protein
VKNDQDQPRLTDGTAGDLDADVGDNHVNPVQKLRLQEIDAAE